MLLHQLLFVIRILCMAVRSRLSELNPEQQIIVHCHAGGRSRRATEFLLQQGFKNVKNLRGGITAWANEIDPTVQKY